MPVRIPVVALALAVGLTCGIAAVSVLVANPPAPSAPATVPRPPRQGVEEPDAVGVLHAWDARRAAAWARGDVDALARLYLPGSRAGASDVALLRRYADRGLIVRDLRMQVLSARVLVTQPHRLVLEVVDRLAGGTAVTTDGAAAAARRLPVDAPTVHRLVLRRPGGQWLMAAVSDAPGSGGR